MIRLAWASQINTDSLPSSINRYLEKSFLRVLDSVWAYSRVFFRINRIFPLTWLMLQDRLTLVMDAVENKRQRARKGHDSFAPFLSKPMVAGYRKARRERIHCVHDTPWAFLWGG